MNTENLESKPFTLTHNSIFEIKGCSVSQSPQRKLKDCQASLEEDWDIASSDKLINNLDHHQIDLPSDANDNDNISKKTYTIIQKKKLADRVENLKSKKHFKHIFKIIYENSDNSYTKDSSGVYINFNSLANNTIQLIEEYLNIIAPKFDTIPLQSKYIPYFSDDFNPKDSGIKLSNHEKNFLKYVGNDSDNKNNNNNNNNNFIESESSLKNSDQNKTKILIKPFSFE